MKTLRSLFSLTALAASFSFVACAPPGAEVDEEDAGEEAEQRADEIIGGSQATAYPEATLIEMKVGGQVTSICSGAVIAPKLVLTAGHCVQGYDGWNIKVPFANNQTAKGVRAETYDWDSDGETVDPNQHDVGVIFLDKAITLATYPTLATSGVSIGSKVQNIGRINNGVASYSKLYIGPPVSVKNGSSYGYPFDYATNETIQSGDSGGPVIVPGTHKIVAVNSGAGGGIQVLARIDLLSSWLSSKVTEAGAAPPPANDPCGGLTYAGQCNGNTVEWCENSQKKSLKCSSNKQCGFDSANQYYNCL